jgi:hypothetical protein
VAKIEIDTRNIDTMETHLAPDSFSKIHLTITDLDNKLARQIFEALEEDKQSTNSKTLTKKYKNSLISS